MEQQNSDNGNPKKKKKRKKKLIRLFLLYRKLIDTDYSEDYIYI